MSDPDLQLRDVKTQYMIRNLESHSVQFNILAKTVTGDLINVELQIYKEDYLEYYHLQKGYMHSFGVI